MSSQPVPSCPVLPAGMVKVKVSTPAEGRVNNAECAVGVGVGGCRAAKGQNHNLIRIFASFFQNEAKVLLITMKGTAVAKLPKIYHLYRIYI